MVHQTRPHFVALDSIRGVAAVLVMLLHMTAVGYIYDIPIVRHAAQGVPLFFVLSGFVISHASQGELNTGKDFWQFMIRRFGRVYPLHFLTLMAMLAIEVLKLVMISHGATSGQPPFTGTNSVESLIANFFLLQAIIPFGYTSWSAPSWSISTEFYTYAVFATLAVVFKFGRLAAVAVALVISAVLVGYAEYAHLGLADGAGFFTCLFGFFTGVAVYAIRSRFGQIMSNKLGLEIAATALALFIFWFKPFDAILTIISFGFVVYVFSFDGAIVSSVLRAKPFRFLGQISLSIYLIHPVIIALVYGAVRVLQHKTGTQMIVHLSTDRDLLAFGPKLAMDAVVLALGGVSIGLGTLSYHFYEEPCRRFFNAVSQGKPFRECLAALSRGRPAVPAVNAAVSS
jgi:peptidoglycan/LPS O-acetylase OafA/YrhL